MKKLNKEFLISELKRCYTNDGIPTPKKLRNPNYPSHHSYVNYFGSLKNALKEAGIDTETDIKKILISKLHEYKNTYKKVPSATDIKKNPNYPSPETYSKYFGSWNNALKIAKLDFDTMLAKGETNLDCASHKGRLFELLTKMSFKKDGAIDLAGTNPNSPFDGICRTYI